MLSILSALLLAQTTAPPPVNPVPQEIIRPQTVRPLPSGRDRILVFNSNSPELIGSPGILLSTFPPADRAVPAAHLNFPLSGRFDIFAHHVYKAVDPTNLTAMYLGIVIQNPGNTPVTVDVLTGASYLSQPDAPFIDLPRFSPFGPDQPIFSGPGSRVMGDLLQDQRQPIFPSQLRLAPGESALLLNQPIPVAELDPPINGRSTLLQLRSSGSVYVATLAQPAIIQAADVATGIDTSGLPADAPATVEIAPPLAQWLALLNNAGLSTPRDRVPTPIEANPTPGQVIYGRVAGVAQGAAWSATVTDDDDTPYLTIPPEGSAFSYGLSTLYFGRLGTQQIQSAPMLVRYPDTAYQAHGNYGLLYQLTFPLYNPTDLPQRVTLALETPIKEDMLSTSGLRFFDPLPPQTFFRGPLQIRYRDDQGLPHIQNIHLVQRRGQMGEPLVVLILQPQEQRRVEINLRYPPDSTPPQVITIQSGS